VPTEAPSRPPAVEPQPLLHVVAQRRAALAFRPRLVLEIGVHARRILSSGARQHGNKPRHEDVALVARRRPMLRELVALELGVVHPFLHGGVGGVRWALREHVHELNVHLRKQRHERVAAHPGRRELHDALVFKRGKRLELVARVDLHLTSVQEHDAVRDEAHQAPLVLGEERAALLELVARVRQEVDEHLRVVRHGVQLALEVGQHRVPRVRAVGHERFEQVDFLLHLLLVDNGVARVLHGALVRSKVVLVGRLHVLDQVQAAHHVDEHDEPIVHSLGRRALYWGALHKFPRQRVLELFQLQQQHDFRPQRVKNGLVERVRLLG